MNSRLAILVRRRHALMARTEAQRAGLAALVGRWRVPLAVADGAFRIGWALHRHPAIPAVAVALLVQLQQHRALLWSGRLFALWEVYQLMREQWPRRAQTERSEPAPRRAAGNS